MVIPSGFLRRRFFPVSRIVGISKIRASLIFFNPGFRYFPDAPGGIKAVRKGRIPIRSAVSCLAVDRFPAKHETAQKQKSGSQKFEHVGSPEAQDFNSSGIENFRLSRMG